MFVIEPALVRYPPNATQRTIDVWSVELDRADTTATVTWLSDGERGKLARFRDPRIGARWAAARLALRHVLATELGEDPGNVTFEEAALGKPRLTPGLDSTLRFNVSHSGGLALIAVARGFEIGVDIERRRPVDDVERVAGLGLSEVDAQRVYSAPAAERGDLFLALWVRREARLKALGTGFRGTVNDVEVVDLVELTVGPDFVAAVAAVPALGITPRVTLRSMSAF